MAKVATNKLIERAHQVCVCGSCLTCMMANRLLGQVEEINNQLRVNGRYIRMIGKLVQSRSNAVKYLKEKRPECALGVLRDRVTDADAILKELSDGQE